MIHLKNKFKIAGLWMITGMVVFTSSCNKDLQQFAEPVITAPTGLSLSEAIAANPNDSLYNRLLIKSGMAPLFNNKANTFTMFVPDNNGMKLFINAISGGAVPIAAPDAVFSGFITANIPAASAAGIVSYNTIGQKITSSLVPATFPNFQLPTQIILPQPPPANPFVRLTTFPAKKTQLAYVNNIPVTGIDAMVANGVIHHVATVVAPPITVLAGLIYPDTSLSYFTAAIARGDSGQVNLNRFDSLLKYGVTNMTVLAPTNAALRALIFGTAYNYALSLGAPAALAAGQAAGAVALGPAIFSTPAFYGILPASSVRGIMAYHFLASNATGSFRPDIRVFSVNFSAGSGFVKTLVNGSFGPHPGIMTQATFTGPFVTSLQFTGLGTFPPGSPPYTGGPANTITMDKHAVNGVLHIIDKVLLPQ